MQLAIFDQIASKQVPAATLATGTFIQCTGHLVGRPLEIPMKLTDTQTAVLIAAAARADGAILPLPAQIRGGAIGKVCDALVTKGFAINVGPASTQTLVISDDGRRALGHEVKPTAATATKPPQGRTGTKQAQLVAMLKAPEGASVEEIAAAFGWLPHTVRGAIAGALKKKLGLQIGSEAIESRGRVYRIMP